MILFSGWVCCMGVFFLHSFMYTQWDFPGGPAVKTPGFHCKGAWVQSLVREIRSCILHGLAINKQTNSLNLKTVAGRDG